jgi:hypothetical protein
LCSPSSGWATGWLENVLLLPLRVVKLLLLLPLVLELFKLSWLLVDSTGILRVPVHSFSSYCRTSIGCQFGLALPLRQPNFWCRFGQCCGLFGK